MKSKVVIYSKKTTLINDLIEYITTFDFIDLDTNKHLIFINDEKLFWNIKYLTYQIATFEQFMFYLVLIHNELVCFFDLLKTAKFIEITKQEPNSNNNTNIDYFEMNLVSKYNSDQENLTGLLEQLNTSMEFLSNHGCNFIMSIYMYCFETNINLNIARKLLKTKKKLYYTLFRKGINTIKELLNRFMSKYIFQYHLNHLYELSTILDSIHNDFYQDVFFSYLKQVLLLSMMKLNDFGLEFCIPPNFSFFIFTNIHFEKLGQLSAVRTEIIDSIFTEENIYKYFNYTK